MPSWLKLAATCAAVALSGCSGGNGDTTIIKKTVTQEPADSTVQDAQQTTASEPPPPGIFFDDASAEYCEQLDETFHLWVSGISCTEGEALNKQASRPPYLPDEWSCAATVLACENLDTGSKFLITTLDGKPPPLTADEESAADAGGKAEYATCGDIAKATPEAVGVVDVSVTNSSCRTGLEVAQDFYRYGYDPPNGSYGAGFECRVIKTQYNANNPIADCLRNHQQVNFHLQQ